MKKNLFLTVAAAALALTSCSNEDVVERNTGNAIDFRVTMNVGPALRGFDATSGNIGQFKVTAFKGSTAYFTDELYTLQDGSYKCVNEYLWPGSDALTFYAYSYYAGEKDGVLKALEPSKLGTLSADGLTFTGFSPATNVADQIDFVTAMKENVTATPSAVDLNFSHQLVQIEVNAKTTNKLYEIKINGVKYANIASTANYNFKTGWTTPTSSAEYVITYNKAIQLNPEATNYVNISDLNTVGRAMLLPQELTAWNIKSLNSTDNNSGAYLAVSLQITTNNTDRLQIYPENTGEGDEFGWALIPISTNWVAGKRYVYNLDFSVGAGYDEEGKPILGGPIRLNPVVTDWDGNVINEDIDL